MIKESERRDFYLRAFWFAMTIALIAGAVVMFENRNSDRILASTQRANSVLNETVASYPETRPAFEALLKCINKKFLTIEKNDDEDDFYRPRQVCPQYAQAIEPLQATPMGMRELQLAYQKFIGGLKAGLS